MATCILEQIAQRLVTVLEAIDGVGEVMRPRKSGLALSPTNNDVVLHQDNPTRLQDVSPYPQIEWEQPFSVDWYCIPGDNDTTAIDTLLNDARSKVEQAIMADETQGGLAVETLLGDSEYHVTEDNLDLVRVPLAVRYRVHELNPYSHTEAS